jgi:hypothetical protein
MLKAPFTTLVAELDDFVALSQKPVTSSQTAGGITGAATARFHGLDHADRPLLTGLPGIGGEVIAARSTVPLRRAQIGATVVVLFEQADVHRPIVLGVLEQNQSVAGAASESPELVSVQADDHRLTLSAEREIVLRCGDASITLTRAGKVMISGRYIVSRSSGYNRIKGAAVDIN